jgi:hypothetical protein
MNGTVICPECREPLGYAMDGKFHHFHGRWNGVCESKTPQQLQVLDSLERMKKIEKLIRNQVADEIEAHCICAESKNAFMTCEFEEAAQIARGNK